MTVPRLPVPALCAQLAAAGVTLEVDVRRGLVWARPSTAVTPALAAGIRTHKPELLRSLADLGPVTPTACTSCGGEFVSTPGRCRWCDAVRGREVTYEPNSEAERAFVRALEAHARGEDPTAFAAESVSARTVPTVPTLGGSERELPPKVSQPSQLSHGVRRRMRSGTVAGTVQGQLPTDHPEQEKLW